MNPGELFRLSAASQHYLSRGFGYLEVPWVVTPNADDTCRPNDRVPTIVTSLSGQTRLPGSGEQGFVQLMLDHMMPAGSFFTTTPCWREEPVIDELHRRYFTKLELISFGTLMSVLEMTHHALDFFREYVEGAEIVDNMTPWMGDHYDIVAHGVELGSYGIRNCWGHRWVYGTGCAEPRLGIAMARETVVK